MFSIYSYVSLHGVTLLMNFNQIEILNHLISSSFLINVRLFFWL